MPFCNKRGPIPVTETVDLQEVGLSGREILAVEASVKLDVQQHSSVVDDGHAVLRSENAGVPDGPRASRGATTEKQN